jgi:hypothetical protein
MWPTRSWRKNIGPGDAIDIKTAIKKVASASSGRVAQQNPRSITRFHTGSPGILAVELFVGLGVTRKDGIALKLANSPVRQAINLRSVRSTLT